MEQERRGDEVGRERETLWMVDEWPICTGKEEDEGEVRADEGCDHGCCVVK